MGIRNAIRRFDFRQDVNRLMENAVHMDLIRNGYNVYIGKNDAKEIDFIAEKGEDKVYIQVGYMQYDEATIQREFGGLMEINNHYPKYVVTMDRISAGNNYQGIKQVYLNEFLLAKDKTKM